MSAEAETLSGQVERISEMLVLAEADDLQALAAVHTCFEDLSRLADREQREDISGAAGASAALLERVMLGEVEDAGTSLGVVGRAVSALQAMCRDGSGAADAGLPPELGLGAEGGGGFALPANVDESILSEFLARQGGVLQEMEALVLVLEAGGDDESLASFKRLVHTMKGEAALLGLGEVEQLCHATEDLLGTDNPGRAADLLLESRDWLGRFFDARSGKGEKPEPAEGLLGRLAEGLGSEAAGVAPERADKASVEKVPVFEAAAFNPVAGDVSLLGDFVSEAREHLESADIHLLTLETDSSDTEAINAVFRAFHTIKGVAGFIGLEEINSVAHEAESLLDRARKGDLEFVGGVVDVTFDAVDALKRLVEALKSALASGEVLARDPGVPGLLARVRAAAAGQSVPQAEKLPVHAPGLKLGQILAKAGKVTQETLDAAAAAQKEEVPPPRFGEVLVRDKQVSAKEVAQALRSQRPAEKSLAGAAVKVKQTVKVDAERLDRLVDTIGELVIAESMVSQSARHNGNGNGEGAAKLLGQLGQLDKITRELQAMGTGLRMVPVRSTFQKMARLVRDLAKKAGKRVSFSMSGEDTELDKSVVDQIGDPLVHMVRNAVDHGIETAEERRLAGKGADGRVQLRAYHKGGNIYVEIQDDGRGMDREVLLAKGRERGLVTDGESMTDREVFNLIFEPGFSTAKRVTEVSGRGVGMDVVKRNIEALHGQAEIRSEKGAGSTFVMRLPLTLAIIDGMVVEVGSERYIIPTLSVVRSVRPEPGQVETVLGRGEMLKLHGRLVPLFRLGRLFELAGAEQDPTRALAVVVEDDGRQMGLLVDELLGQQQIVIKSLEGVLRGLPGLSGAAIMPDGTVGLILDVGGLVKLAHEARGEADRKGEGAIEELAETAVGTGEQVIKKGAE